MYDKTEVGDIVTLYGNDQLFEVVEITKGYNYTNISIDKVIALDVSFIKIDDLITF